jgi:hypothetical protein
VFEILIHTKHVVGFGRIMRDSNRSELRSRVGFKIVKMGVQTGGSLINQVMYLTNKNIKSKAVLLL